MTRVYVPPKKPITPQVDRVKPAGLRYGQCSICRGPAGADDLDMPVNMRGVLVGLILAAFAFLVLANVAVAVIL